MGNAKPVTVARPDPVKKSYAVGALETAYRRITELVASLDDAGFDGPSRCVGWSRRDLLFHVLLDAQRALVSFASPDPGPPDTDYVGYWSAYVSGSDDEHARAHARFVTRSAAAYASPRGLTAQWTDTAGAVVRAARRLPDQPLATQGRVLPPPDLLTTFAVEAAVHHLDFDLGGPAVPLDLVVRTLDGPLGTGRRRPDWDDVTYAMKGTGRRELDAAERAVLESDAARFPLFG